MIPESKSERHSNRNVTIQNDVKCQDKVKKSIGAKKDESLCLLFLNNLTPDSEDADTKIICQNGSIMVHKLLIINISPFMGYLFDDQLPGELVFVMIPDITIEVMRVLVQMMYKGEMKASKDTLDSVKEAMKLLNWVHIDNLHYSEFERELYSIPIPIPTIDLSEETNEANNINENEQQVECERHDEGNNSMVDQISLLNDIKTLNTSEINLLDKIPMNIINSIENNFDIPQIPQNLESDNEDRMILDPITGVLRNSRGNSVINTSYEPIAQELQGISLPQKILDIAPLNNAENLQLGNITPTKLSVEKQVNIEKPKSKKILQPYDLTRKNLRSGDKKPNSPTKTSKAKSEASKVQTEFEETFKAVARKIAVQNETETEPIPNSSGRKSLRLTKRRISYTPDPSSRKPKVKGDTIPDIGNSSQTSETPMKKKRGRPAKAKTTSTITRGRNLSGTINESENTSIGMKLSPKKVVNLKNNEQLVISSTSPNEIVAEKQNLEGNNLASQLTETQDLAIPGPSRLVNRRNSKSVKKRALTMDTQLTEETQKIRGNDEFNSDEEIHPPKKARNSGSKEIASGFPLVVKQSKLDKFFPTTTRTMRRASLEEWKLICFCSECHEAKSTPDDVNNCLFEHDKIKCWQCFEDFKVGNELINHIRVEHNGKVEYKCPWCPVMAPHKALKFFFYHLTHHTPDP